jgi:hypothetical protein
MSSQQHFQVAEQFFWKEIVIFPKTVSFIKIKMTGSD